MHAGVTLVTVLARTDLFEAASTCSASDSELRVSSCVSGGTDDSAMFTAAVLQALA